ncbi:PH domain-containing protein [Micromonospora phytophila]|uniref:PH domain-containing protein n=1 Tax=Micromonospora phytophila TaxID=709888 RepID=UPI00202E9A27|nr:PH domain-containing protein [Micromonospora phytophila]MCM0677568.1 PH domain-containing protein [Micromonospora phytophila]
MVEVVLALVLGLVVNEMTDLSPWLGRKLVTWSARLRYRDDPRAEIRAEELTAVINDRPGKLFKLGTGFGFLSAALLARLRRLVGRESLGEEAVGDDLLGARRVLPLEDEPTPGVARYLFPTERYRGEWRRHWIHPVKSVGVITIYAVLGVWAAQVRIVPRYTGWVVVLVLAAAVLLAAHRVLAWHLGRFVITNKRLMSTEGVFVRRVGMIPLLRVTDMRYVQSPLGRALNYGTFRLESASRRNVLRRVVDLPNPNELYLRLVEEMYEPDAVEARLGGDVAEFHGATDELSELDIAFGQAAEPLWQVGDGWPEYARPAVEVTDPAAVRREVILRIGELSGQLAALTEAIRRLDTGPSEPAGRDERGVPDRPVAPLEEASRVLPADPPVVRPVPRPRLPRVDPLADTGD